MSNSNPSGPLFATSEFWRLTILSLPQTTAIPVYSVTAAGGLNKVLLPNVAIIEMIH